MPETLSRGLTVPQLAKRLAVGEDKIRGWIRRGELRAVNMAARLCGRPRFVVLPQDLAEFEERRQAATPEAPTAKRRKPIKKVGFVDYVASFPKGG